jgi:hypothetical protein
MPDLEVVEYDSRGREVVVDVPRPGEEVTPEVFRFAFTFPYSTSLSDSSSRATVQ